MEAEKAAQNTVLKLWIELTKSAQNIVLRLWMKLTWLEEIFEEVLVKSCLISLHHTILHILFSAT
ncbi:Uncharacterised protein [Streptococcus pneumoniae]|nr:Uncharacterised protein [Streptococcus pneumoniae]